MNCAHCGKSAVCKCSVCGASICPAHTGLQTICPAHTTKTTLTNITITKAKTNKQKQQIKTLVKRFWGEHEQLTFNKTYTVEKLPTYLAISKNNVIGFISYAQLDNAILIVALGIQPQHQNKGIGKRLIKKIETEAKRNQKQKLLVSTSNDDLPTLAFYQHLGFKIYQVKPNAIAEKTAKPKKASADYQ